MIIFAVDSSSAAGSAAVLKDGELLYEAYANEGLTHSETLLVRCDEAFQYSGVLPSQVDVYAVTAGPGSFTGLRIGMGLVKGLAFPGNKPCAAVSTFDALAEAVKDCGRDVLAVVDARQKRVYCTAYKYENGVLTEAMAEEIVPLPELAEKLSAAGIREPLVVGDAAKAAADAVPGSVLSEEKYWYVHAAYVAKKAESMAEKGETVSVGDLRPAYHQLSQAERNRK